MGLAFLQRCRVPWQGADDAPKQEDSQAQGFEKKGKMMSTDLGWSPVVECKSRFRCFLKRRVFGLVHLARSLNNRAVDGALIKDTFDHQGCEKLSKNRICSDCRLVGIEFHGTIPSLDELSAKSKVTDSLTQSSAYTG